VVFELGMDGKGNGLRYSDLVFLTLLFLLAKTEIIYLEASEGRGLNRRRWRYIFFPGEASEGRKTWSGVEVRREGGEGGEDVGRKAYSRG